MTEVRTRGAGATAVRPVRLVDTDVHSSMTRAMMVERASARWRPHFERYGLRTPPITEQYPRARNAGMRADSWPEQAGSIPGSDRELLARQLLDEYDIDFAILNTLGLQDHNEVPAFSAELSRIVNDWVAEEWMARDDRLLGAINVPHEHPDLAVREIERRRGDRRWVQVLLPSAAHDALGSSRYWPIYEAAAGSGLPVAIHTGGLSTHQGTGWPSYYLEEHVSYALVMQHQLQSLVCEGVFETFPDLKVVLTEGGATWAASVGWTLDGAWSMLRDEVPHLRRAPLGVHQGPGMVHHAAAGGAGRAGTVPAGRPARAAGGPAAVRDRLPPLGLRLAGAVAARRAAQGDPRGDPGRQRVRPVRPAQGAGGGRAVIDCDVHCAPAALGALAPYLPEYWRQYIADAGIRLTGLPTAYPPGAPTTGGPAPAAYETLRTAVLDGPDAPRLAILNCLTLFETHRNPYYSAAIATAVNDWLCAEWLGRDDRLRASLVVSTLDVEAAVAEIDRLGPDPRFVQVLLPVRADAPYGNRRYHPIHEAAVRHDLTVGIHAWGRSASAATPSGFTSTYLQDLAGNAQMAQAHILSLVSEGAFARFPDLRVALIECGFTWLPPLLWRFDKDWKSVWREVPWVKERPSEYVRRHFRATTQPAHLPADAGQATEVLDMVGASWLLHASDHPHRHGPGAERLLAALEEPARTAVLSENAQAFYR